MIRASRIKLARELIYCARMVLDASCHREAKSIVAYPSTDIKHLVYRIDPSIIKYIKKFGVGRSFNDSGFVFHHMAYPEGKGVMKSRKYAKQFRYMRKTKRKLTSSRKLKHKSKILC